MLAPSRIVAVIAIFTVTVGQVPGLVQTSTTGTLLCAVDGDIRGEFSIEREPVTCQLRDGTAVDIEELLVAACEQLKISTGRSTKRFSYAFGDSYRNQQIQINADDISQNQVRRLVAFILTFIVYVSTNQSTNVLRFSDTDQLNI